MTYVDMCEYIFYVLAERAPYTLAKTGFKSPEDVFNIDPNGELWPIHDLYDTVRVLDAVVPVYSETGDRVEYDATSTPLEPVGEVHLTLAKMMRDEVEDKASTKWKLANLRVLALEANKQVD